MNNPDAICVDNQGNLYIAEASSPPTRFESSALRHRQRVCRQRELRLTGDLGPAVGAAIQQPGGVAVDAQGDLYIADTGNQRIRRVDANGIITTVAGDGQIGYSGDGGPAIGATVAGPRACGRLERNVYVADSENGAVRVSTGGNIATFAGTA